MTKVEYIISELEKYKQTHIAWAEYFEQHPEIEKEYLATGEWDTAKEHRRIASVYDDTINYINKTSYLLDKLSL